MPAFAQFQNRIAAVTGGASGIGLELMLQLVRRGAHVAACDVNREGLEASLRRARKINPGVRVTAHLHDVSDAEYQPVPSRQAAEAILGAVSAGDWRVVIGQDAEAIDARVRADPWSAYE